MVEPASRGELSFEGVTIEVSTSEGVPVKGKKTDEIISSFDLELITRI